MRVLFGFRPCYNAEGAPPGGAAPAQDPPATPAQSAPEGGDPFSGWWGSQLPKEMREGKHKDSILALKGKGIGDVLGEYFESRSTLERAIVPPGKDAKPEEIKAFLKKMDIPEDGNYGFDAKDLGDTDKEGAFTASAAKEFQKLGLTKKQGQGVYKLLSGVVKAGSEQAAAAEKQAADAFDGKLLEAAGGDEKKAKELSASYKRALVAFAGGDKEKAKGFIKDLGMKGLLYDVSFAVALATFYREHTAEPTYADGNQGSSGGKKTFMHRSDAFEAEYGKRS